MRREVLGASIVVICLGVGCGAVQAQQVDATQQVLDSARRAYNDGKFSFAAEQFQEFLKAAPNSKDAADAQLGLGAALLEAAEPDYAAAVESLTAASTKKDFAQHAQALYYLGVALKGQSGKIQDTAKAGAALKDAIRNLADATATLDKKTEQIKTAPAGELPLDLEFAAKARAEWADALLRGGNFKEAAEAAAVLAESPRFSQTPYAALGAYQLGYALFQLKDYSRAGKSLAQLAPFNQDYGLQARYLLARTHHLSNELPEAAKQYKAILDGMDARKVAATEALKDDKLSAARRHYLEGITNGSQPQQVLRSQFYYAVILADLGKADDAQALFKTLLDANPKSSLASEAQLRLGLLQYQTRNYGDALKTLEPLRDNKQFADQALWFTARAEALSGDPSNASSVEAAQHASLDFFKQAASKAAELAKANSDNAALLRCADILLDMADMQIVLKQYKDAATTCGVIAADYAALPPAAARVEQATERQITCLQLSGQMTEAGALAQKFIATYPKSLLLPSVLLRSAESTYAAALKAAADPNRAAESETLFAAAGKVFDRIVTEYPDFPQVNAARFGVATMQYRLGKFTETAETLKSIPDAERAGDLLMAYYMQGDCMLRTLPPEGDDALATAKMLLHCEMAAKNLAIFVTSAGPKHPQGPDALFKLGYCQQRIGGVLADAGERRKALEAARDAYDKVLSSVTWENPLAAAATLERAKTLASLDDAEGAEKELRRFTSDPLNKALNAPLALLRLSSLLRASNKSQEAADLIKQLRTQQETALAADASRAAWVPMLQYENGVALIEAGHFDEARTLFEALAKSPLAAGKPESINSVWRLAQCKRQQLASSISTAQKAILSAGTPEEIDAASKTLDNSSRGMLEWTNTVAGTGGLLAEADRTAPGSEGAIRLNYELAWGYRVLGEAQLESTCAKMQRDQLQAVLLKSREKPPEGFAANAGLHPPVIAEDAIPVQAMEAKSREAFQKVIAAADAANLQLANTARVELAEMLAVRGKPEEALQLLADVLERSPTAELADRTRVRIAACLLAKGNAKGALDQAQVVLLNNGSRFLAEARFQAGEAGIALKDWPKAIDFLVVFRTETRFQDIPGVADKALLRLSFAFAQAARWDESRQAAEALVQRFPQSQFGDEARFNIGWALQSAKRFDEASAAYSEVTRRSASETAARAQLQIGMVRIEQKKFADAIKALLVVPYTYDYAEVAAPAWYQAGLAYMELKQPADAKNAFERVVKDHPASQYVAEARRHLAELH